MEYIIKKSETEFWGGLLNGGWVSLQNASVFKSFARADKFAKRVGGKAEFFLGKPTPQGTKSFVPAKQSLINRHSAYRSI